MTRNKKHKTRRLKSRLSWPAVILSVGLLIILPLIHSSQTIEPVIYPRFTGLALSLMLIVLMLWLKGKKISIETGIFNQPFSLLLIGYLLITLCSFMLAINPVEGLTELLKWTMLTILFFTFIHISCSDADFKSTILKAIVVNVILALLVGVYQLFSLTDWENDPNILYEVKGLMAHKNQFSIALFLLLPLVFISGIRLSGWWRKSAWLAVFGLLIMLLLLQTRAVWMALFAGTLVVAIVLVVNRGFIQLSQRLNRFIHKGIWIALLGIILLVGVTLLFPTMSPLGVILFRLETILDPQYASNEWRLEMWQSTMNLFRDNAWLGVGTGNWKIAIYPYYSDYLPSVYKHWRSPHNDYLWVASEKGILGLVAYVGLLLAIVTGGMRRAWLSREITQKWEMLLLATGVLGYMIVSFFSFPAERMMHWIYLVVYAGFIFTVSTGKSQKRMISLRSVYAFLPLLVALYLPFHFGMKCIQTEIKLSDAQEAYIKKDWRQLNKFAGSGFFSLAPLEPRYSLPAITYQGLAQVHYLKNYPEALKSFHKAYTQHPNHIRILNNLGSVYGIMGDYSQSAVYFQKTLEIFPHYEIGLINLSKAYFKVDNYTKAYQTILLCDPRSKNPEIEPLKNELEKRLRQSQ